MNEKESYEQKIETIYSNILMTLDNLMKISSDIIVRVNTIEERLDRTIEALNYTKNNNKCKHKGWTG